MALSSELKAQILRCYYAEKSPAAAIARQLHIHRGIVQRVLAQAGLPKIRRFAPAFADRCLPAIHPTDADVVPNAPRQPSLCDGVRARLPR
jgi:hypothetical protein